MRIFDNHLENDTSGFDDVVSFYSQQKPTPQQSWVDPAG